MRDEKYLALRNAAGSVCSYSITETDGSDDFNGILKLTFEKSELPWDNLINQCAQKFYERFGLWPSQLYGSQFTLNAIGEFLAEKYKKPINLKKISNSSYTLNIHADETTDCNCFVLTFNQVIEDERHSQ